MPESKSENPLQDAADARYLPTGHIVFLWRGTLMGVCFDLGQLEIIGQPSPLVENVMQAFSSDSYYNTGAGQFLCHRSSESVVF